MSKRRFPLAAGEKTDPDVKKAAAFVKILSASAKQARQYVKDGCYAPLGGLMQYLAMDARKIQRLCSKLMTKYGR
jgi:hypothetical protein